MRELQKFVNITWTQYLQAAWDETKYILTLFSRSLPREARRDAIDIQSQDQFVEFMRQRDTPSGKLVKIFFAETHTVATSCQVSKNVSVHF